MYLHAWLSPAVYIGCISENFRLFRLTNLSVLKFSLYLPNAHAIEVSDSLAAAAHHTPTAWTVKVDFLAGRMAIEGMLAYMYIRNVE